MAQIYSIVKKNTVRHNRAVAKSGKHSIIDLGKHVMVPAQRTISYGHVVSHAKNRTPHRRMPNLRVVHVLVDGVKKALRLSASDTRTFKKLTA